VQVALLPPAAFAVHELRYWLAFGGGAGAQLARSGHSYLHSVVPWLVLALALVVGGFLRALGRAFAGQRSVTGYSVSFAGLWLACVTALVAIYVCQEFLEGLFAIGHPFGMAGIFGYGGWWSLPAAACVGLVLAAALHGGVWVLNRVAELRAGGLPARRRAPGVMLRPQAVLAPRLVPLADGWSSRGPPV
jgi:hypothetical protein